MKAVKTVLNHVSVTSNISDSADGRKWTFMISDGVPYIYASTMQDSYLVCSICKKEICNKVSQDEFEDLKREHSFSHQNDLCQFQGLFSSIVLIPGHIELSMG